MNSQAAVRSAASRRGAFSASARRGAVPVPWFFFDELMPRVSPHKFTVLLFLWRKTVGWDRWEDWISLSQMQKATGQCRDTVLDALHLWVGTGLVRRLGRRGIRGVIAYEPNVRYVQADVLQRLEALVSQIDRSKESHPTGRNLLTSPVERTDTQDETTKIKSEIEPPPALSRHERILKNEEEKGAAGKMKRLIAAKDHCTKAAERQRLDEEIARLKGAESA